VCRQLSVSVSGVKQLIVEKQRDINRVMTPVIQTHMTAGYDACNSECGPGMYERMKAHMSRHVTTTKSAMFNNASVQLWDQLIVLQVTASVCSFQVWFDVILLIVFIQLWIVYLRCTVVAKMNLLDFEVKRSSLKVVKRTVMV